MALHDDGNGEKLYVVAEITAQDSTFTRAIYRLDGNVWTQIGQPSVRGFGNLISYDDGTGAKLYSTSESLPGDPGPHEEAIRVLEGGQWIAFGDVSMDNFIKALYVWDDGTGPSLYASGQFWSVGEADFGNTVLTGFGKWDGTEWTEVGGGFELGQSFVRNMMAWDDGSGEALYLAGVTGVQKWTGSEWSVPFDLAMDVNPFSSGVPSAMHPFDDGNGRGLFFGGDFESVSSLDQTGVFTNSVAWSVAVYRGSEPGTIDPIVVQNEDTILLPTDGSSGAEFGNATDIDNGVIAVGARTDDVNGADSGVAYLFDASKGVQFAKLIPNDGAAGDQFGYSIAIDDGIVAVGARYDGDNGELAGSAYLFDASTGVQLAKLLPNDGAASDLFGFSIAIDNGIVAVGSRLDDDLGDFSGSVYLFDASTGAQIAKLLPTSGGGPGDEFGFDVAIDSGIVAVGAVWDDNEHGADTGAAYLFDVSTGTQIAKLIAPDGTGSDRFGTSIAIGDNVVAVGAEWDDDRGSATGSVYLYEASTGSFIQKILPTDSSQGDWVGDSVAIHNGVLVLGAPRDEDENGNFSGAAYLFDVATGTLISKLLPEMRGSFDNFGSSVAISNGTVVVGARFTDTNGLDSGAAYEFTVPGLECPADFTGDGQLDFFDISAFLGAFGDGDSTADFTGDGQFDFFDISAFLVQFSAGCP